MLRSPALALDESVPFQRRGRPAPGGAMMGGKPTDFYVVLVCRNPLSADSARPRPRTLGQSRTPLFRESPFQGGPGFLQAPPRIPRVYRESPAAKGEPLPRPRTRTSPATTESSRAEASEDDREQIPARARASPSLSACRGETPLDCGDRFVVSKEEERNRPRRETPQ